MSSNESQEERFEIGFDQDPPLFMIVQIPIAKYAEDRENGAALLYGKLREAQAVGSTMMNKLRARQQKLGVIVPSGESLVVQ